MLFWIWIDNRLNLCVDLNLSLQSVNFWHPNSPNANFIPHVAVISTVAIWPVNDCTFLYLLVCLLVCFGHCQSSGWLPDSARFVPLLRKFLFYQPKSWISLIAFVWCHCQGHEDESAVRWCQSEGPGIQQNGGRPQRVQVGLQISILLLYLFVIYSVKVLKVQLLSTPPMKSKCLRK